MVRLYSLVLLLCLGSFNATAAYAEVSVETLLEPKLVQPGDLAALTVTMCNERYAQFEIKLPGDDRLRLIAMEPGVVELQNGSYLQQHRWILQAVSSGQVEWQQLQAEVRYPDKIETVKLAPVVLEIQAYDQVDTSMDPEVLSVGHHSIRKTSALFLAVVIPLAAAFVLILLKRRGKQ